jgi:hypothetical protein
MFILLVALVVLGIVFVFALFIILAVFSSPYDYLPNEEVDELYNYYSEYFSNLTHSKTIHHLSMEQTYRKTRVLFFEKTWGSF